MKLELLLLLLNLQNAYNIVNHNAIMSKLFKFYFEALKSMFHPLWINDVLFIDIKHVIGGR